MRFARIGETSLLVMLSAVVGLTAVTYCREWSPWHYQTLVGVSDDQRRLVQNGLLGGQTAELPSGTIRRRFPPLTAEQLRRSPTERLASLAPAVRCDLLTLAEDRPTPETSPLLATDSGREVVAFGPDGAIVSAAPDNSEETFGGLRMHRPSGATDRLPLAANGSYRNVRFSATGATIAAERVLVSRSGGLRKVRWVRRWDAASSEFKDEIPLPEDAQLYRMTDGPLCLALRKPSVCGTPETIFWNGLWLLHAERDPILIDLPRQVVSRPMPQLSPDGRYAAVALPTQAISLPNSATNSSRTAAPAAGIIVYDCATGEIRARWRNLPPHVDHWTLHFVDSDTLLAVGDRTGRIDELVLSTGVRRRVAVVRPGEVASGVGWFGHAAALTLAMWAVLWLGVLRWADSGRSMAAVGFATAVLLLAAWAALRLLPDPLLARSPTLWWLFALDADFRFPSVSHRTLCAAAAVPIVAFTLPAAWWNRRRLGRLAWLLALAAGTLSAVTIDIDVLLRTGLTPEWLRPG